MENRIPNPLRICRMASHAFQTHECSSRFQRFMNDIFSDMLNVCVIVYLDDILIYSDNLELHRNHMVISDNLQSRTSPGTQSPWTSSNNYHPPKDLQLSW